MIVGCFYFIQPVELYRRWITQRLKNMGIQKYTYCQGTTQINYWKGGSGPALLLLHGFGSDAMFTWHSEMKLLRKHFTVIAPDLLWFGDSHSNDKPSLQTQTTAMLSLIKALNITDVNIIGQSYGGYVAIEMLLTQKELCIHKLCIANSPGPDYVAEKTGRVSLSFGVDSLHELFVFEHFEKLQQLLNLISYYDTPIPLAIQKQMAALDMHKHPEERRMLMQELIQMERKPDALQWLKKINLLIIWGENDELFSLEDGEKFAEASGGRLKVIRHCGHAPQFDRRRVFLGYLKEFFI
jgi:pimeloyl-ACP methyl ester carboxylesterase